MPSKQTGLTIRKETRWLLNEIKSREAQRIKRGLTHDQILLFLSRLYNRVQGDTSVLDGVWEKIKTEQSS